MGRTFSPEERARSHASQRLRLDRVFWTKIRIMGECWEWTGSRFTPRARHHKRYGLASRNGRPGYAHRRAYELAVGPIPPGMNVLHRCDNPPCVNPAHLFIGTQADNLRDMAAKGRWRNQTSPPLAPVEVCHFCERRDGEVLVDFEGAVVSCCDTCWERGQDELPRGDADDEC